MLKISLVTLGHLKYSLKVKELTEWKSNLLKITQNAQLNHLQDPEGNDQEYLDTQLFELIQADQEADFTVALIGAPLENNYYMRRISEKICVISLFQMAEIVRDANFTIEQYVLRNIYVLVVIYQSNNALIPTGYATWAHDDIRTCLFDMNMDKNDIVFSLHKPQLCTQCTARSQRYQLPNGFLETLKNELKKIQKPIYYRMLDWVREHPILALVFSSLFAISLNLYASYIFEFIKPCLPWLRDRL
ncbi:MAG: hypothetical protein LW632_02530 [Burkholderiaceae bacterium]|nr:hypothetical protein [Burkholderiaceae bacterium]